MNPIKGIVSVVSDYGIGKTVFAFTTGHLPEDICFINDDVKTPPDLEYGRYVDLMAKTRGLKPLELYNYCHELIKELKHYKVIIWDTWTRFEKSFITVVKDDPGKFRDKDQYSKMGRIRNAEMYQDSYTLEGHILSELKSKCDLLIVTFHLKQRYQDDIAVPGKYDPGHNKAIAKYSDLRLWLTPNPERQEPIGLVLKNIIQHKVTDNGIEPVQVLPLRLPICTWKNIIAYWNEPIGNIKQPSSDEKPSEFELSMIEGYLTPEQQELWKNSAGKEKQILSDNAIKVKAKKLTGSPLMIAKQLKAMVESGELNYEGEITSQKVIEWKS